LAQQHWTMSRTLTLVLVVLKIPSAATRCSEESSSHCDVQFYYACVNFTTKVLCGPTSCEKVPVNELHVASTLRYAFDDIINSYPRSLCAQRSRAANVPFIPVRFKSTVIPCVLVSSLLNSPGIFNHLRSPWEKTILYRLQNHLTLFYPIFHMFHQERSTPKFQSCHHPKPICLDLHQWFLC
jgi:hypothetical protein